MIKKLRYILKNYYKFAYIVEHIKEISFLVDNYELIRDLDKDVYELKDTTAALDEHICNVEKSMRENFITLESKKKEKKGPGYAIDGVPKAQKEYILGLLREDGESVLEEKMKERGNK